MARRARNFVVLQEHWHNTQSDDASDLYIYIVCFSGGGWWFGRSSAEILLLIDEVFHVCPAARVYIEEVLIVSERRPRLYSFRVLITNHISDIRESRISVSVYLCVYLCVSSWIASLAFNMCTYVHFTHTCECINKTQARTQHTALGTGMFLFGFRFVCGAFVCSGVSWVSCALVYAKRNRHACKKISRKDNIPPPRHKEMPISGLACMLARILSFNSPEKQLPLRNRASAQTRVTLVRKSPKPASFFLLSAYIPYVGYVQRIHVI